MAAVGMLGSRIVASDQQFACPCCGNLTLDEQPPGTWLICEICGWEDDPVQFGDIEYQGGANRISLRQAREFYERIGSSDPERLRVKRLGDPGRLPK